MNSIEEKTLLPIYRQFTKDEAVAALLIEIKNLRFKVGELNSEISELKHQKQLHLDSINSLELLIESNKMINSQSIKIWNKDEYVQGLRKIIKNKVAKNSQLTKQLNEWRNKWHSDFSKNNK